jgi:hypothetical protein
VDAVNRHTIATSWQTVVAGPEQVERLSEVSVRAVRPVLRVRHQEGVERISVGNERRVELLHSFRPYDDGTAFG